MSWDRIKERLDKLLQTNRHGELRGALSGSVNGTFPEMIIAQGKINDVIYLEKVVEE